MGNANTNPLGVEWFGLVMGLGFVLSFGYWCTDFLVVQRAMAAELHGLAAAHALIAAVPKMFFPFLVILPGLIAIASTARPIGPRPNSPGAASAIARAVALHGRRRPQAGVIPYKIDPSRAAVLDARRQPRLNYDLAMPEHAAALLPTGMLGLGLTALLASFMSGMAGNVTAFNTVWTYDIYQAYIAKARPTPLPHGWAASPPSSASRCRIGAAYVATRFNNIMDTAPARVRLRERAAVRHLPARHVLEADTGHGAFSGLLSGTGAARSTTALPCPATPTPA